MDQSEQDVQVADIFRIFILKYRKAVDAKAAGGVFESALTSQDIFNHGILLNDPADLRKTLAMLNRYQIIYRNPHGAWQLNLEDGAILNAAKTINMENIDDLIDTTQFIIHSGGALAHPENPAFVHAHAEDADISSKHSQDILRALSEVLSRHPVLSEIQETCKTAAQWIAEKDQMYMTMSRDIDALKKEKAQLILQLQDAQHTMRMMDNLIRKDHDAAFPAEWGE